MYLCQNVAPVLISRFKEREESVRVDILNTFITLIRQNGISPGKEKEFPQSKPISAVVTKSSGGKRRKGEDGGVIDDLER